MSKQTEIDEIEAAIDLIVSRLEGVRRAADRVGPDVDPRLIGLFQGDVSDVLTDLERYRDETAAAMANASTGVAVSRAYLSVGKMAAPPTPGSATVLSFDQTRSRKNGSR